MEEVKDSGVKLNVEHHKRKTLCVVLITGLVSLFICVIVAATISPDIIGSSSLTYKLCDNFHYTRCFHNNTLTNILFYTVGIEKYNQILYLEADFESNNEILTKLNYSLVIKSQRRNEYKKIKAANKTFEISCSDGSCGSQLMFYDPFADYELYTVKITMHGIIPVDEIKYSMKFITKEFTEFFLGTKYFFLALSIISLFWYTFVIVKVGVHFLNKEIMLMGILSASLFLFNEPLLAVTLDKLTTEWSGFSVFCNAQFAGALLLFCFTCLRSEMKDQGWIVCFVVEFIFVFVFFVLLAVLYMFTVVELKFDPTFSWKNDLPKTEKGIFIAIIFFLVVFAIWTIALLTYSLLNYHKKTLKNKILMFSIIFLMLMTLIFIGVGSFQPIPRDGSLLLITVSFYNIFIYVLNWMFIPSLSSYKKCLEERNTNMNVTDQNFTVVQGDGKYADKI